MDLLASFDFSFVEDLLLTDPQPPSQYYSKEIDWLILLNDTRAPNKLISAHLLFEGDAFENRLHLFQFRSRILFEYLSVLLHDFKDALHLRSVDIADKLCHI